MKIKTFLLSIMMIILIISLSSCSNTQNYNFEDPYTFTINQAQKDEYIANIGKTITNEKIVYLIENNIYKTYVVYTFENNEVLTKTCYHFFDTQEDFRNYFYNYNISLDGNYNEVLESILLISTKYINLNSKSFNDIYYSIKDTYSII